MWKYIIGASYNGPPNLSTYQPREYIEDNIILAQSAINLSTASKRYHHEYTHYVNGEPCNLIIRSRISLVLFQMFISHASYICYKAYNMQKCMNLLHKFISEYSKPSNDNWRERMQIENVAKAIVERIFDAIYKLYNNKNEHLDEFIEIVKPYTLFVKQYIPHLHRLTQQDPRIDDVEIFKLNIIRPDDYTLYLEIMLGKHYYKIARFIATNILINDVYSNFMNTVLKVMTFLSIERYDKAFKIEERYEILQILLDQVRPGEPGNIKLLTLLIPFINNWRDDIRKNYTVFDSERVYEVVFRRLLTNQDNIPGLLPTQSDIQLMFKNHDPADVIYFHSLGVDFNNVLPTAFYASFTPEQITVLVEAGIAEYVTEDDIIDSLDIGEKSYDPFGLTIGNTTENSYSRYVSTMNNVALRLTAGPSNLTQMIGWKGATTVNPDYEEDGINDETFNIDIIREIVVGEGNEVFNRDTMPIHVQQLPGEDLNTHLSNLREKEKEMRDELFSHGDEFEVPIITPKYDTYDYSKLKPQSLATKNLAITDGRPTNVPITKRFNPTPFEF